MTYVNLTDEAIKYFTEVMSFEELKKWFEAVLSELIKWGNYVYYHRKSRNISIKELEFPFEYREGQRNLAVSVYKAIRITTIYIFRHLQGWARPYPPCFRLLSQWERNTGTKYFI